MKEFDTILKENDIVYIVEEATLSLIEFAK